MSQRVSRVQWLGVAIVYLIINLLRSRYSIHHLIPDPGLSFQLSAWSDDPLAVLGRFGGYPQVAPRIVSEFLNLIPLPQLTYWSTALNSAVAMTCSLLIAMALTPSIGFRLAILPGMFLATSFPAFEGLIGNVWAIRWLLLPATCVVVLSDFAKQHWRISFVLFLLTGLSHPYVFIPAIFFFTRAWTERDFKSKTGLLGLTLAGTVLFQGFAFLTGSRSSRLYGDSTVYWPWTGSGIYWIAVFALPTGIALISIPFAISNSKIVSRTYSPRVAMAIQATLLALLSYLQLGIKSSPAVATSTVSYAAIILATNDVGHTFKSMFSRLVTLTSSIVMLILNVRYFLASSYLTNGLSWSQVVSRGVADCQTSSISQVELTYFINGDFSNSELIDCHQLALWVEWFFRR